ELAKNKENINKLYALSYITSAISNLYKKQNKTAEALKFSEETLKYTKQSYEQLLDNKKKFLEAYYNTEQKNQQIKQLEEKNSIYTKQRLLYIGIIALALAGVVFLIYLIRYRQKLNKQKTDLLEAEKNETQLTLQLEQEEKARLKVEQELLALQQEQLQKQALATSLQLNHKTSFINELKEKIKEDKHVNIDRILKDEKLTDDDFNEVQNLVQDVHPNFFKRLNESSVNKLSNQDLKYAAYIYLNMDNQQIANILKVEPKTVRMTKYRMKQKMGLDKDVDLATFIQNLEL
ncbi:LuxR C-terminal-related transcriptional regulator, partial [Algoriella sp.]